MKLDGKVAIVTGGSAGLGEACVRLLHSLNCKVMIADLNILDGERLAKELGDRTYFIETDVADEDSIKQMISKTIALFSAIHIVINSAGVAWAEFTASPKSVHSSELFLNVFKINVLGTFNVTKYAAQQMMTQTTDPKERGVIINIASTAGFEGQKGTVAYSASKAAVIGMTLPMARDLGKYGIRVMSIAPGIFETNMGKMIQTKVRDLLLKQSPLERFGDPKDLADLCVGIIENGYLTGETIRIDGGARLSNF